MSKIFTPLPRIAASVSDSVSPLSKEGRAWLAAAMRGDYQTLARLARAHGQERVNIFL